jgi:two-component system sensor histidine kinase KdpD
MALASDPDPRPTPRWLPYAGALAIGIVLTLAASPWRGVLDAANVVMLYLLATMGVALRWGRGPAAVAAAVNVLLFDFFFVPPHLSFAVRDLQYLLVFAVMLAVGLVTGQLTAGLRQQARIAAAREQRVRSLFELARDLSAALRAPEVAEIGAAAVGRHFGGDAVVLTTDRHDEITVPAQPLPGFVPALARAVLREGRTEAAQGSDGWQYVPLQAPVRVRGVLALRPTRPDRLALPEEAQHLLTLARQVAIALERVHYVEVAQATQLEMESQRLRHALLAAMSHDVRTPLTALLGLAETLAASRPPLGGTQAELAQALVEQAHALAALVGNLLELARLQVGPVPLRRAWHSVEEVVGSALRALRPLLAGSRVEVRIPPGLPLVEFDATLVERVLANLVDNAVRHGAAPVVVEADVTGDALVLRVRDHGPGLPASPAGDEAALFDPFTRGDQASGRFGSGLGLAICKAAVEAHGGTIAAANAPGGGAEFTVCLPRRAAPQLPGSLQA